MAWIKQQLNSGVTPVLITVGVTVALAILGFFYSSDSKASDRIGALEVSDSANRANITTVMNDTKEMKGDIKEILKRIK